MQKLSATLLSIFFLTVANGQTPFPNQNFNAIDHIPVVVNDLDSISKLFSAVLHFKIKNGREHEGIKNCFVKFPDGTYLEFTMPIDSSNAIGKYYTNALKKRQGGTALAVSVQSADTLIKYLQTKSLPFEESTNGLWKTISPKGINLFFIDYADKNWKDTKENTTHPNTALSLKSTYMLSGNLNTDINKYSQFGFIKVADGHFLDIPYVRLAIGNSYLYLLDATKANKLSSKLNSTNLKGICGFEITVGSLTTIKNLFVQTENVLFEQERTIYFIENYNLFLIFNEP